jgi:chemotaxis protein methyltransferase CheR
LLGTDVDETMLVRASAGCYQWSSVKEMPVCWIDRCFERKGDLLCVKHVHRQDVSVLCQDIRWNMPEGQP